MSWERRGDRLYFYRARRVGRRVVKTYVGPLPDADRLALERLGAADLSARDSIGSLASVRALAASLNSPPI